MNKLRSFIFLSLVVFGAKSFAMDLPATLEFEKLFKHESYSWFVKQCANKKFMETLIRGAGNGCGGTSWSCSIDVSVRSYFVKLITKHNQVFCDNQIIEAFCNRIQEEAMRHHTDTRPSQPQVPTFIESLDLLRKLQEKQITPESLNAMTMYSFLAQCELFLEFLCGLCSEPAVKFLIEQKIAPTAQ